jgi:hypothetical protein
MNGLRAYGSLLCIDGIRIGVLRTESRDGIFSANEWTLKSDVSDVYNSHSFLHSLECQACSYLTAFAWLPLPRAKALKPCRG